MQRIHNRFAVLIFDFGKFLLVIVLRFFWIFVVLFFVGAIAGARNVYKFAKRVYADKSGDVRNRDKASDKSSE